MKTVQTSSSRSIQEEKECQKNVKAMVGAHRHWPPPTDLTKQERDIFAEERERRINRLGNLTLTVGRLNTKLSNKAWPEKQKQLRKNSKLLLNAHLIEDHPVEFTDSDIDARTVALAERVCEIWPGPTPGLD